MSDHMTQKDIIRMAREAEFSETELMHLGDNFFRFAALVAAAEREACAKFLGDNFFHFADLVAAAEREACAKLCDDQMRGKSMWVAGAEACAAAIRAEGFK